MKKLAAPIFALLTAPAVAQTPALVVSQIHNAPGWLPNHAYGATTDPAYAAGHTRVNSGPGWNPTTQAWVPGQPLAAYQLTSPSCTSGATEPIGTGNAIADGTCSWEYLSATDYVSITGWSFDNQPWKTGTAYLYGDYVISDSPPRAYEETGLPGCTSTVAPTGTASGSDTTFATSDGCTWTYWADVLYSSEKSYIPTERYLGATSTSAGEGTAEMAANTTYEAQLWNDREYVAGENGEAVPIRLQAHTDYTQDGFPYSGEGSLICNSCDEIIIEAAPGESFANGLTPADPLTGFDPTKGVAIENPTTGLLTDGFEWRDNDGEVIGLQVKSDDGIGIGGGETHGGNGVMLLDDIVDGSLNPSVWGWSDAGAVFLDAGGLVANSLVVSHGAVGISEAYPGAVVHSTIVNPAGTGSVGVAFYDNWVFVGETLSDDAIFGFAHAAGSPTAPGAANQAATWLGGNDATNAPAADSGTATVTGNEWSPFYAYPLPSTNTLFGVSPTAAFVGFPGDYRLAAGSPLIGAGVSIGAINPSCETGQTCSNAGFPDTDTPDIIGTTRPPYDIGAWQTPSGSNPAPTVTLTLSTPSIIAGQSATLTLASANATACADTGFSIAGTGGSATVDPTATTTYSATCTGLGGSATASATLMVTQPPPPVPAVTLTAYPNAVYQQAPEPFEELSWTSANANSCVGSGFTASATSGSAYVEPSATTTYSMTCTNGSGTSAPATATITVQPLSTPSPPAPTPPLPYCSVLHPEFPCISWGVK